MSALRPPPLVIAALTSHNRCSQTVAALDALEKSARAAGVAPRAVLVDDGSTDGTGPTVSARFPWVETLRGDGSLFWCRGMHRALAAAQRRGPDYLLWLNDDTLLQEHALARLLETERQLRLRTRAPVIVVGTTVDPDNGLPTYGGERRTSAWQPLRFSLVVAGDEAVRCDSMNGNVVLVSASAAACVGELDPAFEHAMGDTDYALRARRAGVGVWAAPGVHGLCRMNGRTGTHHDAALPLHRRWRLLVSRKGLPPRSWHRFVRRHTGAIWPVMFLWPYMRVLLQSALGR